MEHIKNIYKWWENKTAEVSFLTKKLKISEVLIYQFEVDDEKVKKFIVWLYNQETLDYEEIRNKIVQTGAIPRSFTEEEWHKLTFNEKIVSVERHLVS